MTKNSPPGPVLVLGASARVSIPIARSLARHGIAVDVVSFQPEEPDLRAKSIRQFYRLPSRREDGNAFATAFLDLVREKQYDVIFPAGDPPLAVLRDFYGQLEGVKLGCPPPAAIERVLNKTLTLGTAEQCGIRVPFTRRVAGLSQLEAVSAQLRFPLVAKPEKKGASAFRIFYFNTLPDLSAAFNQQDWGEVLLQEYCPGVGVGIELLMHNGECLARFQHRRLKEAPITGGVAVYAISEEPEGDLLRSSIALLRALDWEGVAMVEYRVDLETQTAVLMEVNGRFWGSVSLPIKAGMDFPYYYWQVLQGEQPLVAPYKIGMRWRWSPGYLDRIQSALYRKAVGSTPARFRQLLPSPAEFSPLTREAVWSWSDPWPFCAEMVWSARIVLKSVRQALTRRFVPKRLRSYVGIYSRLAQTARPAYLKLRVRDALLLGKANGMDTPDGLPVNARSFLFVCFGNLMRSPMAETMLKHVLAQRGIEGMVVRSAGMHAVSGREAHPRALAVSRELDMPLDRHRAQPVTPELVASSDVIFAMDFENLAELQTQYPSTKKKIFLMSSYAQGAMRHREIPDPYFGDIETTRRCYAQLSQCIAKLANEIESVRDAEKVK
jgi:protein-tyrosine-phosphatase/predicted ATP-grasp superfamily ATP-dependent carboligase